MATPWARRSRITVNSRSTSSRSRLEVGSSRTSTRASSTIDRLMATSCCTAIEWLESREWVSRCSPRLSRCRAASTVRGLPVDAEAAARLVAEHHVLADREVRAEVDLLVDRGDAGLLGVRRGAERALLARDRDGALVDGVDAGQRLDQRGLPGAVLAHERVHLAGPEDEVHAIEREDAREADGDVPHRDERAGSSSASRRLRGRQAYVTHPWLRERCPAGEAVPGGAARVDW